MTSSFGPYFKGGVITLRNLPYKSFPRVCMYLRGLISTEARRAKKRSDRIDEKIRENGTEFKRHVKILLLGKYSPCSSFFFFLHLIYIGSKG